MDRERFIIWQYRDKPKAQATVKAILSETKKAFETVIDLSTVLDIDTATGYELDLIGKHVGIDRILNEAIAKEYFGFLEDDTALAFGIGEFYRYGDALTGSVRLNDEDYRFFIKAKILKNYQDGTLENITKSIIALFGESSSVVDLQDMTMNILINASSLNTLTLYAVKSLDIVVRPICVGYKYLVLTDDKPFGFFEDDTSYGFGIGTFTRLMEID